MPVVKDLDLSSQLGLNKPEKTLTLGTGRTAPGPVLDNPNAGAQESVALYVWLLVMAGVLVRVMLAFLGPATDPGLAFTDTTEAQVALGETLVDSRTFGTPLQTTLLPGLVDPAWKLPTPEIPGTVDQAGRRIAQVRAQRGEADAVFAGGIRPETDQMPGYPLVLGLTSLTGVSWMWLVLGQCVVGGLLAYPAYAVAANIFDRRAPAVISAAVVALHPAMLTGPLALSQDFLVTALVLLGLAGITKIKHSNSITVGFGGLAIGLAALCQPWAVLVAPVGAAWRMVKQRSADGTTAALLFVVVASLPMVGWVYRNHQLGVGFVANTAAGVDRAFGVPSRMAALDSDSEFTNNQPAAVAALWGDFTTELAQKVQSGEEPDTLVAVRAFGWSQIADHPLAYVNYLLDKTKRLALGHSTERLYDRLGLDYAPAGFMATMLGEPTGKPSDDPVTMYMINAWVGLNALLAAGMLLGFAVSIVKRRWGVIFFATALWAVWLVATPSDVGEQHRLPIMVAQALLLGAWWLPSRPRRVKKKIKHKAGDFSMPVDDAGFTIGPRSVPADGPRKLAFKLDTPAAEAGQTPEPATGRPI